jgi:hypothetical protein
MDLRPLVRPPSVLCPASSSAPDSAGALNRVRVTHPFHPLSGREFTFAFRRKTWGEDRVFVTDDNGDLRSFPAAWTDQAPADPFVVLAAGRSPFRIVDLLALAALIERSRGGDR